MYSSAIQTPASYPAYPVQTHHQTNHEVEPLMACNWNSLRAQLMLQWQRLSRRELDSIGPNRHGLALLIQSQYGIAAELVENYLLNLERTMPRMTAA